MIKIKFSGQLYEKDYVKLMKQIEGVYEHSFGPGDLPTRRKEKKLNGIIVPHDKVDLSGPCAAWAYKLVAEHWFPKRFVILLPDETGATMNYLTTLQDFESVFGLCKVDKVFVQKLIDTGVVSESQDFSSSALELQLPFLQHASKEKINSVNIVPIVVPHSNNIEGLVDAITDISENFVLIVVSNFTKYGPKYFFTPYKYNIKQSQKDLDMGLAKNIQTLSVLGLQKFISRNKLQVSGVHALILGLSILKRRDLKNKMLLSYYRSNKLNEDPDNYVTYMSFSF